MKKSAYLYCHCVIAIVFTLGSCATSRADLFLIQKIPPEIKAEMLYSQGLERYKAEIEQNENVYAIAEIRRYFSDALTLDPLHPKAGSLIEEIDAFRSTKLEYYKTTAVTLSAKTQRTPQEDFKLVHALNSARGLDKADKQLAEINASLKETKKTLITEREAQLNILLAGLEKAEARKEILETLSAINQTVDDLKMLDPGNANASKAKTAVSLKAESLTRTDLDETRTLTGSKKFAEAEQALARAAKAFAAAGLDPVEEYATLKYQLYYQWSLSLFEAKKYPAATEKITIAMRTSRTQESASLKSKIDKAASVKDWDAEIESILNSVDAAVSKGDLSGAQKLINTNLAKLKKQANKDKLSAKKGTIQAQLKKLYQDGIALYNEEDYAGAKTKFKAVTAVDSAYEQAGAYLERTETKLRALSGKD